uniref:Uncharacterized protein n=1 Tax=Oncorhynchus tshawytscha TaxID=74940 RepID=A0AAZ3SI21_ONCTS
RQHSNNATLLANKQRKAPAMLVLSFVPVVSVVGAGRAEWRGDNRHCGGHRLMSSVLNHPSAEWFYAYFICISLNPRSGNGGAQSVKKRKERLIMRWQSSKPCACYSSNLPIGFN